MGYICIVLHELDPRRITRGRRLSVVRPRVQLLKNDANVTCWVGLCIYFIQHKNATCLCRLVQVKLSPFLILHITLRIYRILCPCFFLFEFPKEFWCFAKYSEWAGSVPCFHFYPWPLPLPYGPNCSQSLTGSSGSRQAIGYCVELSLKPKWDAMQNSTPWLPYTVLLMICRLSLM